MNKWIMLLSVLLSSNVLANQIVTLENGQQIQLNDDFTWEYLSAKSEETTDVVAIPLASKKAGTQFKVGANKHILQLSDSGIDILLQSASYESGTLIIPTSITNQSSQSIVLIDLEVEILDSQGVSLLKTEVAIWKSIKRIADTYLRPQSSESGRNLVFEVPQHTDYQINVNVLNVESR
ncbi:DUF3157 family protein [Vibrio cortegadensis]|uniref:DUF3157 family protein n=1 Tax=Vibrio cortegadensis TaxID=1328770 RepID=A0ABV4MAJ8_9VIBR